MPEFAAHLVPYIQMPSGLAELSLCLWLLIFRLNVSRWRSRPARLGERRFKRPSSSEERQMDAEVRRSWILSLFAILLVVLAIEDFVKPLLTPHVATVAGARVQGAIVFFGMRLQGRLMFVGWLVGTFLLILAIGIWRMRRYAAVMANCYAAYVLANIVIYTAIHPLPQTRADLVFAVVYETVAVTGALTLAIVLQRERAHLS